MLESIPVSLLVGTVLGFLSGLGIGGGSLLILWLTMVLGMEQTTARSINLLFFLPAATVACFFRWKQGRVPFRRILPAMAAGAAAAGVCSLLSTQMDLALLKKLFGLLMLVTGFRELLWSGKKPAS